MQSLDKSLTAPILRLLLLAAWYLLDRGLLAAQALRSDGLQSSFIKGLGPLDLCDALKDGRKGLFFCNSAIILNPAEVTT
jgi:hypothetical protein